MWLWFLILLAMPTVIALIGFIIGKGAKLTWKEFIVLELIMIVLIVAGLFSSRSGSMHDIEIWNGWIKHSEFYEEWDEEVSCSHEIECTHLDDDGDPIHSNDGYKHDYDIDHHSPYWQFATSNDEIIDVDSGYFNFLVGVFRNNEYVKISRLSKHYDGGPGNKYVTKYIIGQSEFIPTSTEHKFKNYIKANPNTILRRIGQGNKFDNLIPAYPRVKNRIECDRFLPMGLQISNGVNWNKKLSEINGRLGAKKQVNITIIVANTADSSYIHALEEKWLGGKKNDFVIIVGCTQYPKIDWVRMMSWSQSEDLKVELRDKIMDISSLEKRDEILENVELYINQKFVRRKMADFEYLMAGWQPPVGTLLWLFVVGFVTSVGLTIYFYVADPFGDENGGNYYRRSRY